MPREPLYALSIKQPWAGLILAGLKTVEIRRWTTHLRGPIYLHAARIDDPAPTGWDRVDPIMRPLTQLRGGIIGIVDIASVVVYTDPEAFAAGQPLHFNDPSWFVPPKMVGLILSNPEAVEFRKLTGQVRLFRVPPPS